MDERTAPALILRALQEDHAALRANSPEAAQAHRQLAEELRATADRLRTENE